MQNENDEIQSDWVKTHRLYKTIIMYYWVFKRESTQQQKHVYLERSLKKFRLLSVRSF